MGYITGVPTYVWQPWAPMSFLSAICPCVLGLGIIMSACRYRSLRHTSQWFEKRLGAIAILGSIVFAIGVVASMGYITGVPTYVWQPWAPMSFLSAICSCMLGLGIIMSACRYSELDESGRPRWFSLAVCAGALTINLTTVVAYLCAGGQTWKRAEVIGLLPMM